MGPTCKLILIKPHTDLIVRIIRHLDKERAIIDHIHFIGLPLRGDLIPYFHETMPVRVDFCIDHGAHHMVLSKNGDFPLDFDGDFVWLLIETEFFFLHRIGDLLYNLCGLPSSDAALQLLKIGNHMKAGATPIEKFLMQPIGAWCFHLPAENSVLGDEIIATPVLPGILYDGKEDDRVLKPLVRFPLGPIKRDLFFDGLIDDMLPAACITNGNQLYRVLLEKVLGLFQDSGPIGIYRFELLLGHSHTGGKQVVSLHLLSILCKFLLHEFSQNHFRQQNLYLIRACGGVPQLKQVSKGLIQEKTVIDRVATLVKGDV